MVELYPHSTICLNEVSTGTTVPFTFMFVDDEAFVEAFLVKVKL
jgi:hypothetical protein